MSKEFNLLNPIVQKWIYKQEWQDLREIQKEAISPILDAEQDIVISASTASGKTEAFFLPACSKIANQDEGFGILYISPLKALINDQFRRLEDLGDMLKINVTSWHGDSSRTLKKKAKDNPNGIILITPESIESLLIRESGWVKKAFSKLQYIVIDEFHAFIGSERGVHLVSLLNRLEILLEKSNKPIPRIALSATLGELETVPKALRPKGNFPCLIIDNKQNNSTLKMQVRGYINPLIISPSDKRESAEIQICKELFDICRGDSHLIFANSRQRTESISAQLSDMCLEEGVPNEFFPHHGSLSKEIREELEQRLQKETLPTTAVCTMTLELGIDIGKVNSVAQVTAPHSVSSLRQRLGRSGRRNSSSILRMFAIESELHEKTNFVDKLRMELLQSIAMIRLLVSNKWFEPEDKYEYHFSTLLHQVLAITAQWGGVRPDQIFSILCKTGPFNNISVEQFKLLLTHMGSNQLLTQLSSGEIVLGIEGERLVNQYTFYAVFKTPEEYRIVNGSRTLGTLPIDSLLLPNQHIVFNGRRWKVIAIDSEKKTIHVKSTKGGQPPRFCGEGMRIHDIVRQEMFKIYKERDYKISNNGKFIDFLDPTAKILFKEGSQFFVASNLENEWLLQEGTSVYILSWMGDKVVNTLVAILIQSGFYASSFAGTIEVLKTTTEEVYDCLYNTSTDMQISNPSLAENITDKFDDKYDEWLPPYLLNNGYAEKYFDTESTLTWLKNKLT